MADGQTMPGLFGAVSRTCEPGRKFAEQQSGDQFTVSKSVDTALQLFIGLCFGAASPVFCNILVRLWEWARFWCTAKQPPGEAAQPLLPRQPQDAPPDGEDAPPDGEDLDPNRLLPGHRLEERLHCLEERLHCLEERLHCLEERLHRLEERLHCLEERQALEAQENARRSDQGWARVIMWTILVIGFIGYSVGSSLSATMPAGSSGLSASEHCGPYGLRKDAGAEAQDKDDLLQAKKEGEARQYGRDCYGHSSLAIPDQCNFFVGQAIPYDVHLEQECPFKDINLCPGGGYTAARFTTGLVDASLLGINAEKAPKFNRTLICVPLDMNQGFIKEIPPDSQHHDYRYEYHLGPVSGSEHHSDYTFRTLGDPFKWDMPGYSMR